MSILDPVEKERASELLEAGQPIAAGEMLLRSRHRQHKALRPLVTQCVTQLTGAARQALLNGLSEVAARHVLLAQELLPLSGKDAELLDQIESARAQNVAQSQQNGELLARGRDLLQQGRLETAIEHLGPEKHLPEAKRLLLISEAQLKAYHRYCDHGELFVDDGEQEIARAVLRKAMDLYPQGIRAHRLRLRIDEKAAQGEEADGTMIRPTDRGFLLDFGSPELDTLVLFRSTLVIGASQELADICIPGPSLHAQHAVIYRHEKMDKQLGCKRMFYWVTAHPSYDDNIVRIKRRATEDWCELTTGSELGCAELADGDTLRLEAKNGGGVELVFRQRAVPASSAVLEPAPRDPRRPAAVFMQRGARCRSVVMFANEMTAARTGEACDVALPKMPAGMIHFRISGVALDVSASDVDMLCDDVDGEEVEDNLLRREMIIKLAPRRALQDVADISNPQDQRIRIRIRSVL